MKSKITLSLQDNELQKLYIEQRGLEIFKTSIFFLSMYILFHIVFLTYSIINNLLTMQLYTFWIQRLANLAAQIVLIILSKKFPSKVGVYHGPLLMLCNLSYLIYPIPKFLPPELKIQIFLYGYGNLLTTLMCGFMLSAQWIVTSVTMLAVSTASCAYEEVNDIVIGTQLSVILSILIYCTYILEYRSKSELIQINQTKIMNQDLNNILMNLPEGIILISEEKNELALCNPEFKRLFTNNKEGSDINQVQQILSVPILRPCDNNDSETTITSSNTPMNKNDRFNSEHDFEIKGMLNIIQAAELVEQCQSFQIDTSQLMKKFNRQISLLVDEESQVTSQNQAQPEEIVTFKNVNILYQGKPHKMIISKNITHFLKYEKLKLENHFLEMITATISHDMRTPLNAILGMGKSLLRYITKEQGQQIHGVLMSSAQLLLFLVNDLLDLFKIKNGKFNQALQEVNFREEVQDLFNIFGIQAQEKGVQLIFECSENVPQTLNIDISRIKQILINLVGNSLKFTFKGFIKVYAEIVHDELLPESYLKFWVRDTGIGIRDEDKDKLFQLFGKLESTAKINTTGIGLGLSICQKILGELGGFIYLEDTKSELSLHQDQGSLTNEYSHGTTFTFGIKVANIERIIDFENESIEQSQIDLTFNSIDSARQIIDSERELLTWCSNQNNENLKKDTAATKSKFFIQKRTLRNQKSLKPSLYNSQISEDNQEKKKSIPKQLEELPFEVPQILVVDDNIFNVMTLQLILEDQFGLQSDKALNGLEAIEMVKQSPGQYKIIFMDCNMPIMDGMQTTSEIRKIVPKSEDLYIAALTAYSTDQFVNKCLRAGMNEYICKPVTDVKLRDVLVKVNLLTR